METILPLIIQIVSGAVGGNAAANFKKNLSLGVIGNSIVGIIGGGAGGQLLAALGLAVTNGGSLNAENIAGSIASGGIGGGALLAIIAIVKNAISKK